MAVPDGLLNKPGLDSDGQKSPAMTPFNHSQTTSSSRQSTPVNMASVANDKPLEPEGEWPQDGEEQQQQQQQQPGDEDGDGNDDALERSSSGPNGLGTKKIVVIMVALSVGLPGERVYMRGWWLTD